MNTVKGYIDFSLAIDIIPHKGYELSLIGAILLLQTRNREQQSERDMQSC